MITVRNDRPLIMGILNVTPDSFSDGGRYLDSVAALSRARQMIAEGADLIDVGGESTRPGATEVAPDEELRRVIPVVEGLASDGVKVSVDTSKALVAKECLEAGAAMINDVSAFSDPHMAGVCAAAKCAVCLMHMQGAPRTMQSNPQYRDVVAEVRELLLLRARLAEKAGVCKEHIWLDPGIGFGKTVRHNLLLLCHLDSLVETGYPVMVGISRKSFLGKVATPDENPLPLEERLEAGLAAQVLAQHNGVRMVRTHDVKASVRAATMASAIISADADEA